MKRIYVCFCIVFIASCLSAKSQDSIPLYGNNQVMFNARISPNFSWLIMPERGYSSTTRVGVGASFTADFRIAKSCFISTGVQYSYMQMGIYDDFENKRQNLSLSYVCIPLTLKIKSSDINRHKFYGEFGFDMGVRVSTGSYDNITRLRAGGVIGAGYEYYLKQNLGLQFGLLYHSGFTNIIRNEGYGAKIAVPQTLEIVIGLLF